MLMLSLLLNPRGFQGRGRMFGKLMVKVFTSYTRCKSTFINISKLHAAKKLGEKIIIQGWVRNVRSMKNNIFLDFNDGSCNKNLQVVVPKKLTSKLAIGDSAKICGIVNASPGGDIELYANEIELFGKGGISDGYPFTPRQCHTLDYSREYLHLRPKLQQIASVLRIRHQAVKAFTDFLNEKNFVNIHTPILTSNDCEGGGETFVVKPYNELLLKEMVRKDIPLEDAFFGKKVFLTVSGQLHLEAVASGIGNVYTLAPAFRAENSRSPVHLCEFYMLEVEMAFISELSELIDFLESMIKIVTKDVLYLCSSDIDTFKHEINTVASLINSEKRWPILSFDEAIRVLEAKKENLSTPIRPNEGFSKEQELYLVKHMNAPVFIVEWPKILKPFYMRGTSNNSDKVDAVDLLVPGIGELVGGGLRENSADRLQNCKHGPLCWYFELRKFGSVPTGGFGLGFERYLQLITGIKNIRDVIPFPRWAHNCLL